MRRKWKKSWLRKLAIYRKMFMLGRTIFCVKSKKRCRSYGTTTKISLRWSKKGELIWCKNHDGGSLLGNFCFCLIPRLFDKVSSQYEKQISVLQASLAASRNEVEALRQQLLPEKQDLVARPTDDHLTLASTAVDHVARERRDRIWHEILAATGAESSSYPRADLTFHNNVFKSVGARKQDNVGIAPFSRSDAGITFSNGPSMSLNILNNESAGSGVQERARYVP